MSTNRFQAQLWAHSGSAAWYFVTMPADMADDIEAITAPMRRGFGSVRVAATIGTTAWNTSIFPDKKAQSYLLPVKKQVRKAEGIDDGDMIDVTVALVDF